VRKFIIPEEFFKKIAEKGKLHSRLWFYWLSEFVDEIFDETFIEKQEKLYPKISEIREIYLFGVQLLQQDFKIVNGKKKANKPVKKEIKEMAEKVLDYLNEKSGSTFRLESNINIIAERIAEGFTISDFIIVIDKKIHDWKGTDYEKYIRPITLFSKKFENYLNGTKDGSESTKNNFSKFISSVERAKEFIRLRKDE
jgi:uncharacterized phage protein (TIGR02220 family)